MIKHLFRALTVVGVASVCGLAGASPYVVQDGSTWTVSPYDWSTLVGQTYLWYGAGQRADVQAWVFTGGTMPTPAVTYDAVKLVDGSWVPNAVFFDPPIEIYTPVQFDRLRLIEQMHFDQILALYFHYDTTHIQDALDQAVLSPESTVQLNEGDFFMSNNIEVFNFDGTFKGERVKNTPGGLTRLVSLPGFTQWESPASSTWPAILVFLYDDNWSGGELAVSDLTFLIQDPTHSYLDFHAGGYYSAAFGTALGVATFPTVPPPPECPDPVLTQIVPNRIERIRVDGARRAGPRYFFWRSTVVHGIYLGPLAGDSETRNLEVNNAAIGMFFDNYRDSRIVVDEFTASKPDDYNAAEDAVYLWLLSNCDVSISNVSTSNYSGVYYTRGNPATWPCSETEPSRIAVTKSDIHMLPGTDWAGLEFWDHGPFFGSGESSSVVLSNNKIHSEGAFAPFENIFTEGLNEVVISNNKITGGGLSGIWVAPYGWAGQGCVLLGNNVETFDHPDWWAPIYLGDATANCKVIGHAHDNVIDNGTDNILVGVTNMGYQELGQDVKDAMQLKHELLKNSIP